MAKPVAPLFPNLHPSTPWQQMRPQLEAYQKQVESFFDGLKKYTLDGMEHWGTPDLPAHISDEDLEIELAKLSPAARSRLSKKD